MFLLRMPVSAGAGQTIARNESGNLRGRGKRASSKAARTPCGVQVGALAGACGVDVVATDFIGLRSGTCGSGSTIHYDMRSNRLYLDMERLSDVTQEL